MSTDGTSMQIPRLNLSIGISTIALYATLIVIMMALFAPFIQKLFS